MTASEQLTTIGDELLGWASAKQTFEQFAQYELMILLRAVHVLCVCGIIPVPGTQNINC